MSVVISFFNHKGGVGKTTTVHNLSAALADKGKRVLVIDADPQMNLTASIYGMLLETYYQEGFNDEQMDLFNDPFFDINSDIKILQQQENKWQEYQSKYLTFYDFLENNLHGDNINKPIFRKQSTFSGGYTDLIGGSIQTNTLEAEIYRAVTNKLPSDYKIIYQFQKAIDNIKLNYDFVLIDTQPSASSIIMGTVVLLSDYFISPVIPSLYSLQAIDNLSDIINNWVNLLAPFKSTVNTKGITIKAKFLGIIVQQAKRYKSYSQATVSWAVMLNERLENYKNYAVDVDRIVSATEFSNIFNGKSPYVIEMCYDFTANLRSVAEKAGVPVIHLTQELCNKYKEKNKPAADITGETQYNISFTATCESYDRISSSLIRISK